MSERLRKALRTVPDFPEPGIQFRDISTLLADPELLGSALNLLLEPWQDAEIDLVVGIESRGFLFGAMMAERLGTGFAMARKPGKLPAMTIRETYALEYGSSAIELHVDAVDPGANVLIHDDLVATGGTAAACIRLIESLGGRVVGCSFLVELEDVWDREQLLAGHVVESVIHI